MDLFLQKVIKSINRYNQRLYTYIFNMFVLIKYLDFGHLMLIITYHLILILFYFNIVYCFFGITSNVLAILYVKQTSQ